MNKFLLSNAAVKENFFIFYNLLKYKNLAFFILVITQLSYTIKNIKMKNCLFLSCKSLKFQQNWVPDALGIVFQKFGRSSTTHILFVTMPASRINVGNAIPPFGLFFNLQKKIDNQGFAIYIYILYICSREHKLLMIMGNLLE